MKDKAVMFGKVEQRSGNPTASIGKCRKVQRLYNAIDEKIEKINSASNFFV